MRILFVHSGADLYGASRSLLRLTGRLVEDQHSVFVVLPCDGPLCEELKKKGVRVAVHFDLPIVTREKFQKLTCLLLLFFNTISSIYHLLMLVQTFRPDIIHTNTATIISSGIIAKLARIPHIWHIRESFGDFPSFWKFFQRYMLFFSKLILCVSTPIAEQFPKRYLNNKVQVLFNGFPKTEFRPVSINRITEIRKKIGIQDGEVSVGVVGRIKYKRKGQEIFVQAARLLVDEFPNARFYCIGSPFLGNEEHLSMLVDLIRQMDLQNKVIYTGDIEDIKAAFSALDIVVLSSVQPEPFGGVVIEAMAMGKPVVGTRTGGTVEQIADHETGYLVEPGSPEDMADAIRCLLKDAQLRHDFGAKGRERFLNKFEFEPFYVKIQQLYADLVVDRKR